MSSRRSNHDLAITVSLLRDGHGLSRSGPRFLVWTARLLSLTTPSSIVSVPVFSTRFSWPTMDAPSSPPVPRSSMPPSSAPTPINTNSPSASTPSRRQPPTTTTGALDLGEDDEEAHVDDGSAARKRKRVKGQIVTDVPMVKDAVGESVAESFQTFLKKLVFPPLHSLLLGLNRIA